MEQKQLRQLEGKCIQEHHPGCTTACPIHVDVRTFMTSLISGDLTTAYQTLQKKMPFPGIIARICDRPCEGSCKRKEVGEPLAIGDLENFCVENTAATWKKIKSLPKKGKTIAVIGGGLSGLTAAFNLVKKGYKTVIFEAGSKLGGNIRSYPSQLLPEEVINQQLEILGEMGVGIKLNTSVDKSMLFNDIQKQFNAVFLGLGKKNTFNLHLSINEVTMATQYDGIFAGGSMINNQNKYSPINSVYLGQRAATSIDRYVQNVSLTASRDKEGPYESGLFTNVKGVKPEPRVELSNPQGYNMKEAVAEAERCLLCQCMECVKGCTFLEKFNGYPKRYVREIYNNEAIVMGMHHANKMINSCNLCGLCKELCPNDFDMGEICQETRCSMVRREKMPLSAFDFPLRDLEFNSSDMFNLARHQPDYQTSKYMFFPGCQLSASSPERVLQTYSLLQKIMPGGVGIMLRCCAVPAEWAGEEDLFKTAITKIEETWREMKCPEVILACPTCYKIFKTYLPQVKIVSLWEVLAQNSLPDTAPSKYSDVFSVHDPCGSRWESNIQESVRNIINRLGIKVEELPFNKDKTRCCGYGGLMYSSNPELTEEVIASRINESENNYVTYCSVCRDYFASQGKGSLHLLDLIFEQSIEQLVLKKGPDYSQRRENRVYLKNKLLETFWGEETMKMPEHQKIQLLINDEVKKLLNKRFILLEDIQKTIEFAEKTGQKFINPDNNRFLASNQKSNATYWVEYTVRSNGYEIFNVYSHRMELG